MSNLINNWRGLISFISEARLPRETKRHKSQLCYFTVDRLIAFDIGDGKFRIPMLLVVRCATI